MTQLEADRLEDTPHPRETMALVGHGQAEQALLAAYTSGRPHHAWLIGGLEGIGKATLAYRMAKFVFAYPDPDRIRDAADLSVPGNNIAVRQVISQSHPDLMVLRRSVGEDGKTISTQIKVDHVRKLLTFFGSTAGSGGWRIAIVDTADDLNAAGANALLKILEEPPPRSFLFLIAHHPGRLLATIRSRCRKLALHPLPPADCIMAAKIARADLDEAMLAAAAQIAGGSVRRTIALASGDSLIVHRSLQALLDHLPDVETSAAHALADLCAGRAGDEVFELFLGFLQDWLHARLRLDAPERLARWAEVWEKLRQTASDVEIYNLDRKPFVLSTLSMLAAASR